MQPSDGFDSVAALELPQLARRRVADGNLEACRAAVLLEPFERARRPPRAAREREDNRAHEAGQHGEDDDAAPPAAERGERDQAERRHLTRSAVRRRDAVAPRSGRARTPPR